ncbi:hypothetical protein VN24_20770 [Paenibacillus beijingensis]|uniref:UPF0102 protein VN24_20770 n=1 Tax=Paenibacillus beijingensis TaxID=1126833 RepID=A0A0D5NSB2_9BACL|nr:hypothetical protein VN24_20770 [Paenibacillus beijingensis]
MRGGGNRPPNRIAAGRLGEEAVCRLLLDKGYVIRHRNWRCRSGELDLVAEDGNTLVIVEVRTKRAGSRFGTALEAVDVRKQQQVRATAAVYMQLNGLWDIPVRFDAAAVTLDGAGGIIDILIAEGAF